VFIVDRDEPLRSGAVWNVTMRSCHRDASVTKPGATRSWTAPKSRTAAHASSDVTPSWMFWWIEAMHSSSILP
jgi:hypothetical protein